MFDHIEQLKSRWTDKYVVVDAATPELARFADATGIVKTVNMNGRCLVEFDQYNNIGWYDIDPAALTIVPGPRPKPVKPAAKPAASTPAAKPAAPKPAAPKPAATAKPAAGGTRPATSDILAAARGKAAGGAAAKPSTADILAAARGKAAPPPAPAPAPEPEPEPDAEPEESSTPAAAEPKAAASAPAGPLPTTVAGKVAWCREHDGKG